MKPGRLRGSSLLVLALLVSGCASSATPRWGGTRVALRERPPVPALRATVQVQVSDEPDEPQAALWSDLKSAPIAIASDLAEVWTTPQVWLVVVSANLAGEALDGLGTEESVTDFFAQHSLLPAGSSSALAELGTGLVLFSGAGALYLWSAHEDDSEGVAASKLLMRSLATTGISTIAMKSIFNDERPNGGTKGYPSGHTSMSITAATSIWYGFGPKAGVPAVLLASLVALQRLDSQAHELNDVIGGAALGWVVAATLAKGEPPKIFGATLLPAPSASGDPGISLLWSY